MCIAKLIVPTLFLGFSLGATVSCSSSQPKSATVVPAGTTVVNEQYTFTAPEEAALALADAAGDLDSTALNLIFGPDVGQLSSGNPTQDDINLQRFAAAYDRKYSLNESTPGVVVLSVGEDAWELPIPIVKHENGWIFDTPAGVQEIRSRRVGNNELGVIALCGDLVLAQRQFYAMDPDGDGVRTYAAKFRSSDGKRDGLYWPDQDGTAVAPLGPFAAAAYAKGDMKSNAVNQAYRGYRYRILTSPGASAPGGAGSYFDAKGNLTIGYAIIAWPDVYSETGVMSFLVCDDGVVYQRDFGSETTSAVGAIVAYDPGAGWSNAN